MCSHFWLKYGSMRMIDDDEIGLKEKTLDTVISH